MAVYSMTGYATAHRGAQAARGESPATSGLGVEIRSVNSRFLDLTFKLADDLRPAEPALREKLNEKLKRGKVEIRAWVEARTDGGLAMPSPADLQKLLAIQDGIQGWSGKAQALSVGEVLQLCGKPQTGKGGRELIEALLAQADEAIDGLIEAREREGQRLTAMLLDRINQLKTLAKEAGPLIPALVEQQRQRFLDRWQEAMGATATSQVNSEQAQDRAMTEATAYAIRIDVAEELTRLDAHLSEIERLLKKGGNLGKRLDFLIQELHREANTLGSKSSSLELTRISVDMKVLIEQMREQVQNIE
ncbi:YicC/YloC family endoribonuclease [Hydrogenophaga sp. 5NK40-0174]|uniref:YicC/YloC family endoribonuclease n=1 Tax=Hydrogenophaga sp. 5NK40-0174 TaxID=3127649 RepID=UPI00310775DF